MILRANQNYCRDVAVLRLYIRIHTSIQQRLNYARLASKDMGRGFL